MIKGVNEGYTIVQEMVGVGYKAQANGQVLELSLGFSHNLLMELPKEVLVQTTFSEAKTEHIDKTEHELYMNMLSN